MDRFTKRISDYLISKYVGDDIQGERISQPEQRKKTAYLEAWVSIIGNLLLAIIKGIMGILTNSISLIADAVHTASDVLTSLVVLLGFKLSALPPDEKHPHGHGRIEFIATLIIALMLIGVGVKFGVVSYQRFINNTSVMGTSIVAVIMLIAGMLKEWMSRFSIYLGQKIASSVLIADAWHHRTDAIASLLVAVAIIASKYGYYRVDAVLGFAVSFLIIYTGLEIFKDSASKLIGEGDSESLCKIDQLAMTVEAVLATHDISVHDYGASKVVTVHIEVDDSLSREKAHQVAHQVEELINDNLYAVTTVHVDGPRKK